MSILFFLLFIVILVVFVIRLPAIRGNQGEANVAMRLNALPKSEYAVFNDLLIQDVQYSSQIDHVVVSKYGIFVIETKNYKGWIYGGEYSEHWTQNIWGNKYQLYNPILQNKGHVKALKSYLGISGFPFIPVVVFSSRAGIRVNVRDNDVLYYSELTEFIKSKKVVLLSNDDVGFVIEMLQKLPKYKNKDNIRHIEQVEYRKIQNQMAVSNGRCPKCGGSLILRNGTYGRFYGCSNYPKCKFTCQ